MIQFRSFADMSRVIVENLHRIDRTQFDVVVGIPRSGMVPASMIALHLQLPLVDVESFAQGRTWGRSGNLGHREHRPRVLLVDDSCNKGGAMARAVSRLRVGAQMQITRLAIYGPYQVEDPAALCDLSFETVKGPRVFEWNMWKHKRLVRWAFDFDGVFCRDPSNHENDDGERYLHFLEHAEPLFLPQRPIGTIVTGRLEKNRKPTESYLIRHGVTHSGLVMCPHATKAERMAAGGRGAWKAEIMTNLGAEMFIESNPKQARIIASRTGRPVWCTSTSQLFQGVEP